jgi:hypothetical protein
LRRRTFIDGARHHHENGKTSDRERGDPGQQGVLHAALRKTAIICR